MLAIRSPLAFWFVLATLLMAPPATFAWQAENPNSPFTPLGLPGLPGAAAENPLSLTAEYQVAADRSSGWITVRGAIQPGWKVYSTTQKAGGPLPSKLTLESPNNVELARPFVASRAPKIKPPDENFPVPSEEYSVDVEWSAPLRIPAGADAEAVNLTVQFSGLACQDDGVCMPVRQSIPATYAGEWKLPVRGEYSNRRVHATIRGELKQRTVMPGETVQLTLTAVPAAKYHVYALADRDPNQVAKPALIAWKEQPGWPIGKPVPSQPPIEKAGEGGEPTQYYHEEPITWTVTIQVPEDAAPAGYEFRGVIGYQTCTNKTCDPPGGAEFSVVLAVTKQPDQVDATAEPLSFKPSTYAEAAKLAAAGPTTPAPGASRTAATTSGTGATAAAPSPAIENYQGPLLDLEQLDPQGGIARDRSILIVLPTAFLAGFILNFMPCVLPVIGLKIVSFVQQAGQSRGRIFLLNVWYSAGLLSVFMVLATLAVFAGFGWGEQFQKPTFNIVLTSVVFAFALSFLGVWEIPLPGFIGTSGANQVADREGPAGAFAKGALTTVLATPCSGPLLVPALAWALQQPPALTYTVFFFVGLGMAAPYLVVGAFPRLIGLLPRPGEWMETFKQIMGFVLLGTVVYLLSLVPARLTVPTVAFLMGLWFGLWWVGRTPVWEAWHKRIRAWAVGGTCTALVGMFAFLWWAGQNNPAELKWEPYSRELLSQRLLVDKRIVFVDFTADWCPNCKVNERIALNVPQTKSFVEANGIATIKADMTNDSPHIDELLNQLAGTTAIPVYAIFHPSDPYHPIVLEGLLSRNRLMQTLTRVTDGAGEPVRLVRSE